MLKVQRLVLGVKQRLNSDSLANQSALRKLSSCTDAKMDEVGCPRELMAWLQSRKTHK